MPHIRSFRRLRADRSSLLVIDLQQKLCPAISSADAVVHQIMRLVQATRLLEIPSSATVQYPKGLGSLVGPLSEAFPHPEEKLNFSAAVCRRALDQWSGQGRDQIVIVGIETHVCIMQTVLDLIAEGLRPFVVANAVAARNAVDHEIALLRMRDEGAVITTVEAVLFEWLESANHPQFKSISQIVKT
jgi:isochorismate hydrolase